MRGFLFSVKWRQSDILCGGAKMNSVNVVFSQLLRAKAMRAMQALCLCVGVLLACAPAFSQGNQGRILGTITDKTGGVVSNATVTVLDVERGVSRTLTTDDAGEYSAPQLLPGTYKVRAESKGFSTTERSGILLEVGKEIRVDLSLSPGQQNQTITVTEQLPVVETTNATLGGTLSNQTINDLPLNGRNYQNLLSMRPGVLTEAGGGSWTQSTNGVRPEDNVYMVDGMLNVGAFSALSIMNAPALAGDAASILPIDAIQEFNVEENPRAEYGWKPGAVINVGVKSGTNSLHGTAYAFGRDTGFDARNFFTRVSEGCTAPCPKTELNLEQYGATVGGPIKKDKIFFFGGYEGQRYTVGSPVQANVPVTGSLATPNPNWSVADAEKDLIFQCGRTPLPSFCANSTTANLSALSLHLLNNYFPANNTSNIKVPADLPSNFASDNWVAKFDFHVNDKHTFNAMYFIANSTVNDEDAAYLQPYFLTVQTQRPEVGNVDWTFTPNSRLVNEAQFGVQYLLKPSFVGDHNVNPTTYGLNTGVTNPLFFGMPQIMITGNKTTFTNLGGGGWPKIQGPETDFIAQDHVSYLAGKHSFKFGGEIVADNFTGGALNGARGSVRFGANTAFKPVPGSMIYNTGATALEDFLLGDPNRGQQLVGNALRRVHSNGYAAFVQDDWRVTPRVILNLGVRYEINTVPQEVNDLFGNFLPSRGLVQVGNGLTSAYNGDHNNFAPRLGLAWDIFGTGKTVLRTGGSIIYEELSYNVFLAYSNTLGLGTVPTGAIIGANGQTAGGNIQVASFTFAPAQVNWNGSSVGGATIFPTGLVNCSPAYTPPGGLVGTPCNTVSIDPNLRTPYVTTWTMEIQHAFTNNLSLEVGYVGDHGTKLVGFSDINQPNPALIPSPTFANTTNCTPCEQAARPYNQAFPYLASIFQLSNQDLSNYNSLQATLTQRTSHGLSFTAGYTYSHGLDDASSNFGGGLPQDSTHPKLDYGASEFDIRHRFTLATTYALPGREGFGQMLKGWQLNSIATISTAQPWNAPDGTDDIDLTGEGTGRWNFFGNPNDFKSTADPSIPSIAGTGNSTKGMETSNAACNAAAESISTGAMVALAQVGCYAKGSSVLVPPALGTFATVGGRNIFRGSGFKNWDVSVTKEWKFREALKAQFRVELFNVLNHPIFATPGVNGAGNNSPTGSNFGAAQQTPDTAASNPVLGSGGNRAMQLGLKLIF
jgi:carboxypeptidase family protein/TonB-dependent receptor-like protein